MSQKLVRVYTGIRPKNEYEQVPAATIIPLVELPAYVAALAAASVAAHKKGEFQWRIQVEQIEDLGDEFEVRKAGEYELRSMGVDGGLIVPKAG